MQTHRNAFRSYHHSLITEGKNPFLEVKNWLKENMRDDYVFEELEVPYTIEYFASVYIENAADHLLFKLRWYPEE